MADLNPDQAIEQLRKLPPDRQKAVLAKLSPEAKKGIMARLSSPQSAPVAAPPPATPGFFKRAAEGLGIPNSKEQVEAAKLTPAEMLDPLGGLAAANHLIIPYAKNLYEKGMEVAKQTGEAGQNIREGGPVGANLSKPALAGTDFLLNGVLGPVGGSAVYAFGEDIGTGNRAGAAGDAVAAIVNALLLNSAKPLEGKAKVNKVSYAANLPESVDVGAVKTVLPDLNKAASSSGTPKTVGDLLKTVKTAKDDMNTQAGIAMRSSVTVNGVTKPLAAMEYVPTSIADSIRNKITPDMVQTPEGRGLQNALMKAAKDYEKPWTYEQLDAARTRAQQRLSNFYNKSTTGQYADTKLDTGVMVDQALVKGVQDIVYPAMDKAAGKPAGYFANLKQRQSTLIDMEKALDKQATALATRSAKIKGSPRFSSENVSAYGHPASTPGISIHKLQNIVIRENPEARANRAVKRAYLGRPVSAAAVGTYPVRALIFNDQTKAEKPKTPGEMRKDITAIRKKYSESPTSSNPAMPNGPER